MEQLDLIQLRMQSDLEQRKEENRTKEASSQRAN